MTKKAFDRIAAGLNDAIAIASDTAEPGSYAVHPPAQVDIKAIRKRLGLSQAAFAERYGFSLGRIRDWEQGLSSIDTPSRILLTVIDKEPEAIKRALSAA